MNYTLSLPQGEVYYDETKCICITDDITQEMLNDFNKQYGKIGRKSVKHYLFKRHGKIIKIWPNSHICSDGTIITVLRSKNKRCR